MGGRENVRKSLARGFAEGFGSIGFVFASTNALPTSSPLFLSLLRVPVAKRQIAVKAEVWRTVRRYMGEDLANRLSSSALSGNSGQLCDSKMIRRDFAKAISNLDV
jgi:hypothetical protein